MLETTLKTLKMKNITDLMNIKTFMVASYNLVSLLSIRRSGGLPAESLTLDLNLSGANSISVSSKCWALP